MFCRSCGKQIPDNSSFCSECGAQQTQPPAYDATPIMAQDTPHATDDAQTPSTSACQSPAFPQTATASPAPVATPQPQTAGSAAKPTNGKRKVAIAAAIAAAVICVAVAVLFYNGFFSSTLKAQINPQQSKHAVVLPLSAPGYDSSTCTHIPVRVTGTDATGTSIDEIFYIDDQGRGISLRNGTYTLVVVASPLLSDGSLYGVPSQSVQFSIGSSTPANQDFAIPSDNTVNFTVKDPAALTEDEISAAYNYAVQNPDDKDKASTLKDKVESNHSNAIAQQNETVPTDSTTQDGSSTATDATTDDGTTTSTTGPSAASTHRYAVYNTTTTWTAAESNCKAAGGHLATVSSASEQQEVYNLIVSSGGLHFYWIGMHTTSARNFTWVDGTSVSYLNWDAGEPNNKPWTSDGENYVGMWLKDGSWNDFINNGSSTDGSCGYVCEWD